MIGNGYLRRTAVITVGLMIWLAVVPTLSLSAQEEDVLQRARRLIDGGDLDGAIKLLEDYILKIKAVAEQRRNVAEAYYTLAKSYYMAGEDKKSEANLRLVFETYPEYAVKETNKIFLGRVIKIRDEVRQAALEKIALEAKQEEDKKRREEEERKVREAGKKPDETKTPVVVGGTPVGGAEGKARKKFPWLAVVGGAVALGVLAVVLLSGEKEEETGDLSIRSTPTGARVFLDGTDTGRTTDCVLSKIKTGAHSLRVELENYGKWEGSVQVVAGQTAEVSATLAGFKFEFVAKWGGPGSGNGQFNGANCVAVDSSGNVYVSDTNNHRVQKFNSSGAYLAKFGTGSAGTGDGQLYYPHGLAVDSAGNVYVGNNLGARVQKFGPNGAFLLKWGSEGSGNGQFSRIDGVAVDSSNNVYVAADNRVQKFTSNGVFVTKWGSYGTAKGYFDWTYGIVAPEGDNVYVVDVRGCRVQKFTKNGAFLAEWGASGSGNGQFLRPLGVAVDPFGYCLVVDSDPQFPRVQKFTSSGGYVAKWGTSGSGDGQFKNPVGIAIDPSGLVYVADEGSNFVQKFRLTTTTMAAATVRYSPLRSGSGPVPGSPSSPVLRGIVPGKPAGPAGVRSGNPKKNPPPEEIKEIIR